MPLLTSLLFNNHHKQQTLCCSCGCHMNEQETSSIIRWFPLIRRRSSSITTTTTTTTSSSLSSSSSSSLSNTFYDYKDRGGGEEGMEDKQVNEFQHLYRLAVDEMAYAIESQGSIYYSGDLISATDAVNNCLDRFQRLMQILNSDKSHKLQQEWTDILFELRSKLDSLPSSS
ncbi:uncharacterized protein BX663DRAFT_548611 [Cokeromyces recurvatus]|uniref:uncharacterized protein n=1 Tax=Cokeromyces recurvatus TaxID=90255 RepID=UPI0022210161|nr:uncharacterized protein BX663DRAFT_548611 [Cokeromyces recurvatus]KAI7906428.1 hypothetical protein BX663DRAFT_548611 [Cokeromyces recurvatus]